MSHETLGPPPPETLEVGATPELMWISKQEQEHLLGAGSGTESVASTIDSALEHHESHEAISGAREQVADAYEPVSTRGSTGSSVIADNRFRRVQALRETAEDNVPASLKARVATISRLGEISSDSAQSPYGERSAKVPKLSAEWPLQDGVDKGLSWAVSEYSRIAISPDGTQATRLDKDGVTRAINPMYAKGVRTAANMVHTETHRQLAELLPQVQERITRRSATVGERLTGAYKVAKEAFGEVGDRPIVNQLLSDRGSVGVPEPGEGAGAESRIDEARLKALKELFTEIEYQIDRQQYKRKDGSMAGVLGLGFKPFGETQKALILGYKELCINDLIEDGATRIQIEQAESRTVTDYAKMFYEEVEGLLESPNETSVKRLNKICDEAVKENRSGVPLSFQSGSRSGSRKPAHLRSYTEKSTERRRADPDSTEMRGPRWMTTPRMKRLRHKLGGGPGR